MLGIYSVAHEEKVTKSEQETILRDIILNTRQPLVIRNFSPEWKCFDKSLPEWCKQVDRCQCFKKSRFVQMPKKFGDSPQWERCYSTVETTFEDFYQIHSHAKDKWTAYAYKPVHEMPKACSQDIDFSCFGFPDASCDATFWLSSKGANTPCHYDTYGCNIVVQIYGSKRWLLFPPETPLTPVRIPYEESSVYCAENFYSPQSICPLRAARSNAYECVLQEGDVLIVPRLWWHYVESRSTSLSINSWIPLLVDIDAQIEECIVKYIVEKIVNCNSQQAKEYILNPNQLEFIEPDEQLTDILTTLLKRKCGADQKVERHPYQCLPEDDVVELIEQLPIEAQNLQPLTSDRFDDIIKKNMKRYTEESIPETSKISPILEHLINAICHPCIIKGIKRHFLENLKSDLPDNK